MTCSSRYSSKWNPVYSVLTWRRKKLPITTAILTERLSFIMNAWRPWVSDGSGVCGIPQAQEGRNHNVLIHMWKEKSFLSFYVDLKWNISWNDGKEDLRKSVSKIWGIKWHLFPSHPGFLLGFLLSPAPRMVATHVSSLVSLWSSDKILPSHRLGLS